MIKTKIIFICLFIIFPTVLVHANQVMDGNRYYYKIKDLKSEWKVYSEREDALVPFIESINSGSNAIHILINQEQYINNSIFFSFKRRSAIFINNQLAFNAVHPEQKIFSIDSLKEVYGPGKLILSIFVPDGIYDLETSLVTLTDKNPDLFESMDHLPILKREDHPIWDFMKIGIIIILILYMILVNIGGRVFNEYYNILNSFLRVSTDDFLNRTRKITRIDLFFIIVLSFVISFFLVILINRFQMFHNDVISIGKLFVKWIWFFTVILAWIMIRFFIISISSDLFKMRGIGTVHTFEYLRITNFYSLLIFLLLVILLFVIKIELTLFGSIILYSLIAIGVLRAVILYFKFLNSSDFSKLYIFAYLCSAELLPVIIGLKFLLKSNLLHPVI